MVSLVCWAVQRHRNLCVHSVMWSQRLPWNVSPVFSEWDFIYSDTIVLPSYNVNMIITIFNDKHVLIQRKDWIYETILKYYIFVIAEKSVKCAHYKYIF